MVSAGIRLPGTSRKQGKGSTTVTEKELRKLNRAELLEMLIAQSKRLSRVEEEPPKKNWNGVRLPSPPPAHWQRRP